MECTTCGHEQSDHIEGYGRCLIDGCSCVKFKQGEFEQYIPDGYYFKDDLDGGRLVKKEK
jgi:hypothetical protein